MAYTVENKQGAVAISVLQTAEKVFTSPKAADQLRSAESSAQASAEQKAEVYFQIED
jgi:hypothetical protein